MNKTDFAALSQPREKRKSELHVTHARLKKEMADKVFSALHEFSRSIRGANMMGAGTKIEHAANGKLIVSCYPPGDQPRTFTVRITGSLR